MSGDALIQPVSYRISLWLVLLSLLTVNNRVDLNNQDEAVLFSWEKRNQEVMDQGCWINSLLIHKCICTEGAEIYKATFTLTKIFWWQHVWCDKSEYQTLTVLQTRHLSCLLSLFFTLSFLTRFFSCGFSSMWISPPFPHTLTNTLFNLTGVSLACFSSPNPPCSVRSWQTFRTGSETQYDHISERQINKRSVGCWLTL